MMKWIKQLNGFWLAQGKKGNFLVWQTNRKWHGRYPSNDGLNLVFMPIKNVLSEMFNVCEKHTYWENTV